MHFTLTGLWASMGLFARMIVVVMFIMSIVSLYVTIERLIVFAKSKGESMRYAQRMAKVLANGDLDQAAESPAGKNIGHLGRVIEAGLAAYRSIGRGADHDLTYESVARALERQAAREVQLLKRGTNILATVSSTAPFVGLLGTVMGIVTAFQQMAASGSGGLGTVSAGIAEALVTTAFGLLVAIPAVMAYNYVQSRIDGWAVDISESSNELLDVVARRLRGAPSAAAE
jgi:biopolymer transport protein TolQ